MRDARDMDILLGDSLYGIDQYDADIGPVHGGDRADHRVSLDLIRHPSLPPKPRGVDEDVALSIVDDLRVDRIPCGPRDLGDNDAVFPEELIDHRALPHIRLSDEGDPDPVILRFLLQTLREMLQKLIQQIPEPQLIHGGHTEGIPEPQLIELIDLIPQLLEGIHLVHAEHNRLMGFPEQLRDRIVRVRHTASHIDDKEDDIGRLDRKLCL